MGQSVLLEGIFSHVLLPRSLTRATYVVCIERINQCLTIKGEQTLKAEDFRKYPRLLIKLQDSSRRAIYDVTVPDPRLGEAFIELPYFLGAPYSSKAQSTR